jgi:hypothetical protein
MIRILLVALFLTGSISGARAQTKIISTWTRNTTAKTSSYWYKATGSSTYTLTPTTDSADVLKVAYTNDSVWIYSHGMTNNMGAYGNPGVCSSQTYVHRFPRVPVVTSGKTVSPKVGQIGLLLNGIPIYGLGDAKSYSTSTGTNLSQSSGGGGVWNVEVYLSEGVSLDTAFSAHPQQGGAYHSHAKPKRLYQNYASTVHSPIIGWAFDGYPVYGPYGYTSALSSASGISRMKTGYSQRNISTRTTLPTIPNGGGNASSAGPAISGTFPIGTYIEDYEWLSANGGDLDQYNGRYCVTPEFPSGTYAYFVTIDASGTPQFPYIIGPYYYGVPVTSNYANAGTTTNSLSIPASANIYNGSTILGSSILSIKGAVHPKGNQLSWSLVASESLSSIELQRSSKGKDFDYLTSILTQRTAADREESYSFLDQSPMQEGYYRVKLTDANGEVTYSAVVFLRQQPPGRLNVYPSIASNMLNIDWSAAVAETPSFSIADVLGTVHNAQAQGADGHYTVDVSNLAPGAYVLRMQAGGTTETTRFIKN